MASPARTYRACTDPPPARPALATIAARLLEPASILATAHAFSADTATSSLGPLLGLVAVHGNELLAMLDWLLAHQKWIEKSLARRHLSGATLLLYDVSSTSLEGRCCPLATFDRSRDGKPSEQQLVFGLLCAADGCPIAVELLADNTADPCTVASQVAKVRQRFGLESVALVGDRGMLTTARLRADLEPAGLGWIAALKADSIRSLLRAPRPDQPAPDQVAEIRSPDYPGERLLVCLNSRLRSERARKREALLQATEAALEQIARAVRGPGRQAINRRVGREVGPKQVAKHFLVEVGEDWIRWSRRAERIAAEVHLEVRPASVYNADHVRGHVLVCLLPYYVEWHLRRRGSGATRWWRMRRCRTARRRRPPPSGYGRGCRCTACGRCWRIWRR